MKPIRQTAAHHHAAGEFINQDNFVIANDIILVPGKKLVRPQALADVMHQCRTFGVIQGLAFRQQADGAQLFFQKIVTLVRESGLPRLFIKGEMFIQDIRDHLVDCRIHFRTIMRRT